MLLYIIAIYVFPLYRYNLNSAEFFVNFVLIIYYMFVLFKTVDSNYEIQ